MFPITDIDLQHDDILFITRAMLAVARVDGIKPQEEALIGEFYRGALGEGADMADLETLCGDPTEETLAVPAGMTAEARELAVALCLMAGYADGHLSPNEWGKVLTLAAGLGLPAETVETLAGRVRDSLLSELSLLPDAGSVARVAHELEELSD